MNLPNNIYKAVEGNDKLAKNPLQVKTFVFSLEAVESGEADDTVNFFCARHGAMSIVLDRHNGKLIYRIIYRNKPTSCQ